MPLGPPHPALFLELLLIPCRLYLLHSLILRETVGRLWSVLLVEPRGSSKWVSSVGAQDLASGGGPVCLCLSLNLFNGSRRRQKRREKPILSQEPGEAPCFMFQYTHYCWAWVLKCLPPCLLVINQITKL